MAIKKLGHWRWTPPDKRRVEIEIHPDAKDAMVDLLLYDPRYRGVGYSEFIMMAVRAAFESAESENE